MAELQAWPGDCPPRTFVRLRIVSRDRLASSTLSGRPAPEHSLAVPGSADAGPGRARQCCWRIPAARSIGSRAVVRTLCAYGVGLVEWALLELIAAASSGVHHNAGEAPVLSGDAAHEQTEHNGQHGGGEDDVEDQDEGHWALPWSGSDC